MPTSHPQTEASESESQGPNSDTSHHQRFREYRDAHRARWDTIARSQAAQPGWGGYYHDRLAQIYRYLVGQDQRILELGCGFGNLLASLEPSVGVGIDFSPEMIARAKKRHPHLRFLEAEAHELELDETFDVIILSDLVNDLWDVQTVFERLAHVVHPGTRIIINLYSRLWQLPLSAAKMLGMARPSLGENWLTVEDVTNLLCLTGFEVIKHTSEIMWPIRFPLVDSICNRFLVKLWPLRLAALTNIIIARPAPNPEHQDEPLVSVIVPARNEAGNIASIFERTPEMGAGTELVFVEGHSSDDTLAAIEAAAAAHPERRCVVLRQPGEGKGDAVRHGFAAAAGQVLMILDADLTVPPEDLPRFYRAVVSGKGEFVNGVRLVYPMEDQAMRFFNLVANKAFSLVFTWILGQPVRDTLCGTKVLWKRDYERIAANRSYFGEFDPFGDFDLIFGAARLNLRLIDVPIRYRQRVYGATNIHRWRHGLLLLRMTVFAARRMKFI